MMEIAFDQNNDGMISEEEANFYLSGNIFLKNTSKTFKFSSILTQIQFQFQIQIQIFLPFSKMFQNVPKVSKSKQTNSVQDTLKTVLLQIKNDEGFCKKKKPQD